MLFLPGQFSRRADFYYQLGQLTAAGLGVQAALEQIYRAPPAASFRPCIRAVLDEVALGGLISDGFARCPDFLPRFDLSLLRAGEKSGRLDATFHMLASYYQERAVMARRLVSALMYPVFLLHFAIFILPVVELFKTGDVISYLLQTLGVLLPLYALVAALVILSQGQRGETWRTIFEKIAGLLPLVGMGRRQLALGRLAAALEALVSAGETLIEAWPLAAAASGSPALRGEVRSWLPYLAAGKTPGDMLNASHMFPETFSNLYGSGEISGKLDETLRRLARYYSEEGTTRLHTAARVFPGLIYGVIALYIGWRVVSFWLDYFGQINQVMGP